MSGSILQANFYIKKDDRLPALRSVIADANGPVPLFGATVTFRLRAFNGSGAPKVSAPATIIDAAKGIVQYNWAVGDTDTVGFFDVEWYVIMPGGQPITFPNNGNIRVEVFANLAA